MIRLVTALAWLAAMMRMELRTNAGDDWQSGVLGNPASTGTGIYAPATYTAISEDATAPAITDTALTGELTTGGLGRAQSTYAHTAGSESYTLTKTFTSTDATARTIRKAALFNASATGTMAFVNAVPSPPQLVSGDSLTITHTVTI